MQRSIWLFLFLISLALVPAGLAQTTSAAPAQFAENPPENPAPSPPPDPAKGPVPAEPRPDGVTVGQENLYWVAPAARFFALIDMENSRINARLWGPKIDRTVALYLNRLAAQGRVAGLAGVLYDNRDRGHSRLDPAFFPQLTPLFYSPDLVKRGWDYGLAETILFPAITIGNSSTAITAGRAPRSLPRLAMTNPTGPQRALQNYAADHIYVYPEHRDHDATDRYPANWPYMLISQGSSGSDQPFLRTIALIIASFTPETRARLRAEHLVAPTVQMVFRRAQTAVRTRAAYFSGAAHPTVFDKSALNPTRMMALANSLTPDSIPPVVVLSVKSEDFVGKTGLLGRSERLFSTPSAIARIWRGWAWEKQMVVSAGRTRDPNNRPLRFTWVLLRGDPERVKITPLDDRGQQARITVNWQDARQILPNDPRTSNRVDIGVFASNGVHDSAPAFVSISFPTHQIRRYAPDPTGRIRLAEIDYDAAGRKAAFDPVLHWSAPWRDQFKYGPSGRLTGWLRTPSGDNLPPLQFAPSGRLLDGRQVIYEMARDGSFKMAFPAPATISPQN